MNKIKAYIPLLFIFFNSCQKQEVISTVSKQGKIIGYQSNSYTVTAPLAFGEINYSTAAFTNSQTWLQLKVESNQAMITPQGLYAVPSAVSEVNSIDSTKIYTNNIKTQVAKVYKAPTKKQVVGLMYLPFTAKSYAVQEDTVFEFTLNDANNTMQKGTAYTSLKLNTLDVFKSSTAHGYLPNLYVTAKNKMAILNVANNTVDTIQYLIDANLYGIRYNHHDSLIYYIRAYNGSVKLVQINPTTKISVDIATLPVLQDIDLKTYTATIHCCENKYILFQNKTFYNIDIKNRTVEIVPSDTIYQGLIWSQY
ncbi:MAG: hypothetical protein IPP81_19925 [Chitinophagaceae bacterium]|nr:hypothetical protein [Chitinophagaceae bacterium]